MKKKFTENPILSEILVAYQQSDFSGFLSFYEYCQLNFHANQLMEVNDLVDQFKVEQSMRSIFHNDILGESDMDEDDE